MVYVKPKCFRSRRWSITEQGFGSIAAAEMSRSRVCKGVNGIVPKGKGTRSELTRVGIRGKEHGSMAGSRVDKASSRIHTPGIFHRSTPVCTVTPRAWSPQASAEPGGGTSSARRVCGQCV